MTGNEDGRRPATIFDIWFDQSRTLLTAYQSLAVHTLRAFMPEPNTNGRFPERQPWPT